MRKTDLPKGANRVKKLPPLRSLQERERAFTLSNLTRKETGAPNFNKEREHNVKSKRKRRSQSQQVARKRSVRERERAFSVSLVKQEGETKRKRTGVLSLNKLEKGGRTTEGSVDTSFERSIHKLRESQCSLQSVTVRNPKPSFGFFLQAGAHKELRNAKKPQLHSKHSTKHLRLQAVEATYV